MLVLTERIIYCKIICQLSKKVIILAKIVAKKRFTLLSKFRASVFTLVGPHQYNQEMPNCCQVLTYSTKQFYYIKRGTPVHSTTGAREQANDAMMPAGLMATEEWLGNSL